MGPSTGEGVQQIVLLQVRGGKGRDKRLTLPMRLPEKRLGQRSLKSSSVEAPAWRLESCWITKQILQRVENKMNERG